MWSSYVLSSPFPQDWTENGHLACSMKKINQLEKCDYVPRTTPHSYYVENQCEPEDVYEEQDELWDDENFLNAEERKTSRSSSSSSEDSHSNSSKLDKADQVCPTYAIPGQGNNFAPWFSNLSKNEGTPNISGVVVGFWAKNWTAHSSFDSDTIQFIMVDL